MLRRNGVVLHGSIERTARGDTIVDTHINNVLTGQNPLADLFNLDADAARLVSKALISTYLSFFPVVVGMVKGLRSPDQMQLDLMHTYNASRLDVFMKLRWPASMPFLFASMKVGIAIALIGALVAELTNTAAGGLGVRLLTGSYNVQTITIWGVLLVAATLAAILVIAVGLAERLVLRNMGQAPA